MTNADKLLKILIALEKAKQASEMLPDALENIGFSGEGMTLIRGANATVVARFKMIIGIIINEIEEKGKETVIDRECEE